MLNELLKSMKHEFGFLAEEDGEGSDLEAQVEKEVLNKLDRSSKLDEVETVTFGLETDDGKIVKVYVKAEEAEAFEKALSDKLGEVDDIEEALNELAKEFEIVDVDWPDEENGDSAEDAEAEDDGSESLDKEVYKDKSTTTKPKLEGMSIGDVARFNLTEDSNTIESRLNTASQLMVYHAIIELGIPEVALNRNPYKAAIIKGIRDTAYALSKNASMKQALKMFVKKASDYDKKDMPEHETEAEHHKPEHHKSEHHDHHKDHMKESIDFLTEAAASDFWTAFTEMIRYVSPDPASTKNLLDGSKIQQLMTRSTGVLGSRVSGALRMKMNALVTAMTNDSNGPGAGKLVNTVTESASPDEITGVISAMLKLADPSKTGLLANAITSSTQFVQLMTRVKTKLSQKFNGQTRTKLTAFKEELDNAVSKLMGNEKPQEAVVEAKLLEDQVEWTIETGDDGITIGCGFLKMIIGAEDSEKLAKALSNHDAIVVKSVEGKKYVFSPRGTNVQVKQVGGSTSYVMAPTDVDKLVGAGSNPVEDEAPEDEEAKETGDEKDSTKSTPAKKVKVAPAEKPEKKELDPHVAKKKAASKEDDAAA
jgi:hypothetical protein